jgi:GT2 family glycosyltransferase
MSDIAVSIAIPTLNRGLVLLETISTLLAFEEGDEILVIDQTAEHPGEVETRLREWDTHKHITWIRLQEASIPKAMNTALHSAVGEIVLFLDDDIVPEIGLCAAHAANYSSDEVAAVAGQVVQPWQTPVDLARPPPRRGIWEDLDFPFNSLQRAIVKNCIACNFSVRRRAAIGVGGFDERFIGSAYRFETEFCRRLSRKSGKVVFDPKASVRHLKAETGGTRSYGEALRSSATEHHSSAFYFGYLESSGLERLFYFLHRIYRNTRTLYFLKHPWLIPSHVISQIRSLIHARRLYGERQWEAAQDKET